MSIAIPRRRAWKPLLWTCAWGGFVAGAAAAAVEGTARRLALLALLAFALGLASVASRRGEEADDAMGGAGYEPPLETRVRLLHVVLTLLYACGLIIVVYAGFARLGLLDMRSPLAQRLLPLLPAVFVLLLGVAAAWRISEQGVVRAWYTRTHGWILAFLSLPILGTGVILLFRERLVLGGLSVGEADLKVLVLVGVLGVATQLFLTVRLPTMLDLARVLVRGRKRETRGRLEETPPVLYALTASLLVLLVVGFFVVQFDLLRHFTQITGQRLPYLVVLLPIGVLAFFVSSLLALRREGRRGLYKKRIPTRLRNDLVVYGFSAVAGLGLGGLLLGVQSGRIDSIGPFSAGTEMVKDLAVLTILATAGPIGVYLHRQNRRIDSIEGRLPDFLLDLAENRRAGLTLPAALQAASQADYGALSADVRKMAHQVAWGVPFNEALRQFAQRTRSSLVKRSATLVIESSRTGGSVADILRAAARDAYELKALESERRITMATYLIVLYVVFFVFMVVVAVLDVRFIPEVLAANRAAREAGAQGVSFVKVDQEALRFVYFNAAVVQAVGNGLVAGVLAEGRVTAGLRHVAIMTFMAWVLFRFVLPLA